MFYLLISFFYSCVCLLIIFKFQLKQGSYFSFKTSPRSIRALSRLLYVFLSFLLDNSWLRMTLEQLCFRFLFQFRFRPFLLFRKTATYKSYCLLSHNQTFRNRFTPILSPNPSQKFHDWSSDTKAGKRLEFWTIHLKSTFIAGILRTQISFKCKTVIYSYFSQRKHVMI